MPKCNRKCKIYSRVVGYYTDTDSWNPGKQEEFKERKTYKMDRKISREDEDHKSIDSD